MKAVLVVCALAATAGANPLALTFQTCEVSKGKAAACAGNFTGVSVQRQTGLYRECEIKWGKIRSCKAPFTGDAVIEANKLVKACKVARGVIQTNSCKLFDGKAILERLE